MGYLRSGGPDAGGLGALPSQLGQTHHPLPFPTTSSLVLVDPADSLGSRFRNCLAHQPTALLGSTDQHQALEKPLGSHMLVSKCF